MSLKRVWEFRCDDCGIRRTVDDNPYSEKPYRWTGPHREDGEHICDVCQERREEKGISTATQRVSKGGGE